MNILAVYKHKTVMRHCFPFLKRVSCEALFFFLILLLVATVHVKKRQEKIMKLIPIENIELRASMAVEFEYEKILSSIDKEKAAIIRGLVWEKERDAAVAGYNGCI